MKEQPYKYMVRLPVAMRALIAESARYYRRSMNSDIVARLQHSFSGLGTDNSPGVADQPLVPPLHDQFESLFRRDLSKQEELLVRSFRRLSGAKRDALLDLLT
jgi:hypothetical protein